MGNPPIALMNDNLQLVVIPTAFFVPMIGKCSFDQLLRLADQGDHRKVDMLVRDIYGGDYAALGLHGDVIASSFGLAARSPEQPRCLADAIKALLITVSK